MSNKINSQVTIHPQTDNISSAPKEVKVSSNTPAGALDSTATREVNREKKALVVKGHAFTTPTIPFPELSPGEAMKNLPALKTTLPKLDIETMMRDVENYKIRLANAPSIAEMLKIIAEMNSNVEAVKAKVQDIEVAKQAKALYESGDTAGAEKLLQTHVNRTIAKLGKENVPEDSILKTPLAITAAGADSANGVLDITAIILAILAALDELRTLSRNLSAKQNQAALEYSLKAADETRKAGHEKMVAGVVAGALGIVAGIATIGGSLYAVRAGFNAGKAARADAVENNKFASLAEDLREVKLNKLEGAEMSRVADRWNTMSQAGSGIVKTSGELGGGIQQTLIAGAEAQGQENSAYAQNANQQADTTRGNATDLLSRMLSLLETLSKLMETKNQGVASIITKI